MLKTAAGLKEMDIAEKYKVTSSQERFLILNTAGEEPGELILGFASPVQLEVMRGSPSWYCDGTTSTLHVLLFWSQPAHSIISPGRRPGSPGDTRTSATA